MKKRTTSQPPYTSRQLAKMDPRPTCPVTRIEFITRTVQIHRLAAKRMTSAKVAVKFLRDQWEPDMNVRERMYILVLDTNGKLIGYHCLFAGGVGSMHVDLKVIFGVVCGLMGSSFILAHNHPSGNPKPSPEDYLLNTQVSRAAAIMGVRFHDHLIITESSCASMAQKLIM